MQLIDDTSQPVTRSIGCYAADEILLTIPLRSQAAPSRHMRIARLIHAVEVALLLLLPKPALRKESQEVLLLS